MESLGQEEHGICSALDNALPGPDLPTFSELQTELLLAGLTVLQHLSTAPSEPDEPLGALFSFRFGRT